MDRKNKSHALALAHKELPFQHIEKGKRASELAIANEELAFQNAEKCKRASELIIAFQELKKTEKNLKEHIKEVKEMLFITSHKVRQPVANILGLTALLQRSTRSKKLTKIATYLTQSALSLDIFTRELTPL
jgi:light-regulated signal transduction histidine kinase (bacteriophytochrome)